MVGCDSLAANLLISAHMDPVLTIIAGLGLVAANAAMIYATNKLEEIDQNCDGGSSDLIG